MVNDPQMDPSPATLTNVHPRSAHPPSNPEPQDLPLTLDSSQVASSSHKDSVEPSHEPSPQPATPKAVNVWNIRKEQMALSKAAAQHSAAPQTPTPPRQPQHHLANGRADFSANRSEINGLPKTSIEDDPFVVRHPPHSRIQRSGSTGSMLPSGPFKMTRPNLSHNPPKTIKDDWPEVGKAMSSTAESSRGSSGANVNDQQEKDKPPARKCEYILHLFLLNRR